ncbi:TfuA-like protein [Amaricoccus solimangrovi]|uniref:TfuA-like core domain-containing protein n=1 Tax=Amaricoccus solimangrovi TaxID=2589815 RepID=A0A501WNJ9_9RHOB|nr:TfuA-like protein [Amaricoccus solimangrovi]TPE49915.1 hypothetical protein FJM51_13200 [Amaricoccus solimangrovi]
MRAVVFAGPSLGSMPVPPPGVEIRGPAVAGDLHAATCAGVAVIGLVDGAFEDRPTVWHKEILFALSQGVRVLGAASLGALRAVECASFGMEGVGEIFARFRDGGLEDDAELALVFGPAEMGYPALSVPLVNIRATLERAEAEGILGSGEVRGMLALARAVFFKELTWPRLLSGAAGIGWAPETAARFAGWLPGGAVDLKRADAQALIAAAAAALDGPAPAVPTFRFAGTRTWRRAVEWFERRGGALAPAEEAVLDEMRLDPIRFERALIRAYARRAARDRVTEAERSESEMIEELRLRLDLPTAEAFRGWLAEVGGEARALVRALDDEERLQTALEGSIPELAPAVLDDARIEGRFGALAARAEAKRAMLGHRPPPRYDEAELRAMLDVLGARRRFTIEIDDLDLLARALGLTDRRALHRLLWREEAFAAAPREKSA